MTSRELIKRTLDFRSPQRVARDLWALPMVVSKYPEEIKRLEHDFPADIIAAPPLYPSVSHDTLHSYDVLGPAYTVGQFIDPWGCIFENYQPGIIGEVKTPLLKDWADVDTVRIPREFLDVDIDGVNAFCRRKDKFVYGPAFNGGDLPRPFERLQFIRKTENLYMDLADQPPELFTLINRMHQFYIDVMELWGKTEVDGLFFMDDWGSQNALLIAPSMWRQIFKPLYKDYIDIAHHYKKPIFFHSDGYIADIIPDLVELGLDAINSQIFCMGVEELGRRFAGKITFWGEIDRQHILPFGSAEDVIRAVELAHKCLYRNGGAIAQCEFGAGAKPENVHLVYETWDKF
ncbi:methyltransferase [candidate division KSB1 bacterium]|nr:methyltransferase [candidate division KSB1 bacterium]